MGPLRAAAAGGLVALASHCGKAAPADPFRTVAATLRAAPGIAPRLSVEGEFRSCRERVAGNGTVPAAECAAGETADGEAPDAGELLSLSPGDPRTRHALALLDLVLENRDPRVLDRSIATLRSAAGTSPDAAGAWGDLAAALIVRSERDQSPRDLLAAYEAAGRASSIEPWNHVARYNAALALDRFGLVDEARRAWAAYLAVDSVSGWADEARRRVARLGAMAAPPPQPGESSSPGALAAYAMREPQGARELSMDRWLASWGTAILAGRPDAAETYLRRAEDVGVALEDRPGGDATVADAVRAIRAVRGDPAATRTLAQAHEAYGAGRERFEAMKLGDAARLLAQAERGSQRSPALRRWVRVHLATALIYERHREAGLAMLNELTAPDIAERQPALAARARWSLANTATRAERWEAGLGDAHEAARIFLRAGERENAAASLTVSAAALFLLGEPDSAYADAHRALALARPYRASVRLHSLLVSLGDAVALDGLTRAALVIEGEDVAVSRHTLPIFSAEALLRRAKLRAALGDRPGARGDVESARPLVQGIAEPYTRGWLAADLRAAEAFGEMQGGPARRAVALDSAAAFFAGQDLLFRELPARIAAAQARLDAGDAADAARRLEVVMGALERRRDSIRAEPRRAAVFDAAQGTVERLVLLELADGRPREALLHLDRARASLTPSGRLHGDEENGVLRTRPGEVALEYALIGDTMVVWAVAGTGVRVTRSAVDTVALRSLVARAAAGPRTGVSETALDSALTRLHQLLLRPVTGQLGPAEGEVVIVAGGLLAAVPFAALRDPASGRYLVEDHPIRFAVSLREAGRAADGRWPQVASFMADPAFSPREHPLLERLSHARSEVATAARLYPRATILQEKQATPEALAEALTRGGVVHFAGHAVFDDDRPERSYLALAPSATPGRAGRMMAQQMARLDLRRTRLVVLSACSSGRSGYGLAAGYTGISGALLAAGAGGVVASTWSVDDRTTAALMEGFHRAYRSSRDASRALRRAQLGLLRHSDPAMRSPAMWAAFRYTGL